MKQTPSLSCGHSFLWIYLSVVLISGTNLNENWVSQYRITLLVFSPILTLQRAKKKYLCHTASVNKVGQNLIIYIILFIFHLYHNSSMLMGWQIQPKLHAGCTSFIEILLLCHLSVSSKTVVDSFPTQWLLRYFITHRALLSLSAGRRCTSGQTVSIHGAAQQWFPTKGTQGGISAVGVYVHRLWSRSTNLEE